MKLTKDEVSLLCVAIMEQAVHDYLHLIRKHKKKAKEKGLEYSLKELLEFFGGEWCEWIVDDALHFHSLRGTEILKAIDPAAK